jgi:hypothetical protein
MGLIARRTQSWQPTTQHCQRKLEIVTETTEAAMRCKRLCRSRRPLVVVHCTAVEGVDSNKFESDKRGTLADETGQEGDQDVEEDK